MARAGFGMETATVKELTAVYIDVDSNQYCHE